MLLRPDTYSPTHFHATRDLRSPCLASASHHRQVQVRLPSPATQTRGTGGVALLPAARGDAGLRSGPQPQPAPQAELPGRPQESAAAPGKREAREGRGAGRGAADGSKGHPKPDPARGARTRRSLRSSDKGRAEPGALARPALRTAPRPPPPFAPATPEPGLRSPPPADPAALPPGAPGRPRAP